MTIDECATAIQQLGCSTFPNQETYRKCVLAALASLVASERAAAETAERERCLKIFRAYLQAVSAAWGPGASNPPKTSDYLDNMERTAPGAGIDVPQATNTVEDTMQHAVDHYDPLLRKLADGAEPSTERET